MGSLCMGEDRWKACGDFRCGGTPISSTPRHSAPHLSGGGGQIELSTSGREEDERRCGARAHPDIGGWPVGDRIAGCGATALGRPIQGHRDGPLPEFGEAGRGVAIGRGLSQHQDAAAYRHPAATGPELRVLPHLPPVVIAPDDAGQVSRSSLGIGRRQDQPARRLGPVVEGTRPQASQGGVLRRVEGLHWDSAHAPPADSGVIGVIGRQPLREELGSALSEEPVQGREIGDQEVDVADLDHRLGV